MAADRDDITEERDEALAEVARLKARLDAMERALSRYSLRLELLNDAALRALEYLTAPNPYLDLGQQRERAVFRLEDALAVNGSQVLKFEIRSDKN